LVPAEVVRKTDTGIPVSVVAVEELLDMVLAVALVGKDTHWVDIGLAEDILVLGQEQLVCTSFE